MFLPKLIEVDQPYDLLQFRDLTESQVGVRYPFKYLESAKVFALFDRSNKMSGGFIVQARADKIRTLAPVKEANQLDIKKPVELTGLWLSSKVCKERRILFWIQLCTKFFPYLGRDAVFCYDTSKNALGKMYQIARPKIVFSGVAPKIEGMTEDSHETICKIPAYKIALLPFMSPRFFFKKLKRVFQLRRTKN